MAGIETTTLRFEDVWAAYARPLQVFVRRRVGDPDAAEDIVAEVMLRVARNLGRLDDPQRLEAWVYRIARNAIADHYRRQARRPELVGEVPDHAAVDVRADAWIDDQDRIARELARTLRPLVAHLPPQYRRAIELTDLGGATQAQAAALEQVSISGMKSRVQRARRQLGALLRQRCRITLDVTGAPADCVPRDTDCRCGLTPER